MRPDGPRDAIVGPDGGPEAPFPLKISGTVIKGFGRGSKEVCIPRYRMNVEQPSEGTVADYYCFSPLHSICCTPSRDG
jgi:riboflavin kinase